MNWSRHCSLGTLINALAESCPSARFPFVGHNSNRSTFLKLLSLEFSTGSLDTSQGPINPHIYTLAVIVRSMCPENILHISSMSAEVFLVNRLLFILLGLFFQPKRLLHLMNDNMTSELIHDDFGPANSNTALANTGHKSELPRSLSIISILGL
jgi:hypothetical protein